MEKNPNEGRIQIQHTLLCKKLKKGNIFGWWQLHACLSSSHLTEIRKFLSSQYALSRNTEPKGFFFVCNSSFGCSCSSTHYDSFLTLSLNKNLHFLNINTLYGANTDLVCNIRNNKFYQGNFQSPKKLPLCENPKFINPTVHEIRTAFWQFHFSNSKITYHDMICTG